MARDNNSKLPKYNQSLRRTHGYPIGSVVKSPRSITELAMGGDLDDPLQRVTTARATIIIYSTGKRFSNPI